MKRLKKFLPLVFLAGLPFIGLSNAQASSEFGSSAAIGFSIEGISNDTDVSGLGVITSDLGISGSFGQDIPYDILTGDASINDLNPDEFSEIPPLVGNSYEHTFSIFGSVNNGSAESYHLGLYGFTLFNLSTIDTYTFNLGFSYLLSASASGENSDTDVSIDYYSDEDLSFTGFDYLYHSSVFGGPVPDVGNSGLFAITLAPGEAAFYLADVSITGNLMATPVPLPGAVWFFVSGMFGVFGLKKRKAFIA
ncbi:MAG: hypothetical protein PHR94_08205 [Methylomonas lenta]|nr:hypothetical protein [Methylomonas lenta]